MRVEKSNILSLFRKKAVRYLTATPIIYSMLNTRDNEAKEGRGTIIVASGCGVLTVALREMV